MGSDGIPSILKQPRSARTEATLNDLLSAFAHAIHKSVDTKNTPEDHKQIRSTMREVGARKHIDETIDHLLSRLRGEEGADGTAMEYEAPTRRFHFQLSSTYNAESERTIVSKVKLKFPEFFNNPSTVLVTMLASLERWSREYPLPERTWAGIIEDRLRDPLSQFFTMCSDTLSLDDSVSLLVKRFEKLERRYLPYCLSQPQTKTQLLSPRP